MLQNDKRILIYGFNKEDFNSIVKLIEDNNLPKYKIVEESMGKMTLKDILEGLDFKIFNCNLPEEKVILFNNLDDEEIDIAIKLVRNNFSKKTILAVVTQTSINWTFEYLLQHLIEEREWHKKHSR